jgi:hypothetical protein
MIGINASSPDFARIAAEFQATERQIHAAIKRAVSRTTRWAAKEAPRRVSKAVSVAAKIVKDRVYFRVLLDRDGYGRVWVGLRPISLGALNPRQTKAGVSAGPARVPGAFIAKEQVFKRRGKERLPLDRQALEIEAEGRAIVDALGEELAPKCLSEFERELRWQTRPK